MKATSKQLLLKAADLVSGERRASHGDAFSNFSHTARLWTAYLNGRGEITAHDVPMMMVLLKVSRTQSGKFNEDDYVDAAGYSALAAECFSTEIDARRQVT